MILCTIRNLLNTPLDLKTPAGTTLFGTAGTEHRQALFDAATFVCVGNGSRTLFWEDRWIDGHSVSYFAPTLIDTVRRSVRRSRTVAEALPGSRWVQDIIGGLTVQVVTEFLRLWYAVEGVALNDAEDKVVWRWSTTGVYSAKSAYLMLHAGSVPSPDYRMIWEDLAPPQG